MTASRAKRIGILVALLGPTATLGVVGVACSSSSKSSPPTTDAGNRDARSGDDATGADGTTSSAYTLTIACSDTTASIYSAVSAISTAPGQIVRCAPDSVMTADAMYAIASGEDDAGTVPYAGPKFSSGASIYRVLYQTQRGDSAGTVGYSSALLFVPDTPRAAKSPIIVASHGSRGQAAYCAPSTDDPQGWYVSHDFINLVYPLVGYGYAVIAPDLAGYANGGLADNAMSAYANANDVGRSTLDGARALASALRGNTSSNVVITGHSQGGGTAFSALAVASTYAPELHIAGVAVYAPLWFSLRSFTAILDPKLTHLLSFPFPGQDGGTSAGPVSIWYHYTSAELLDGPGHGLDVFSDAGRGAVQSFVDNACWWPAYPMLEEAGTTATAVFDPAFMAAVGPAALPWNFSYDGLPIPLGQPATCNTDGGPMSDSEYPACACAGSSDVALCTKWITRYLSDRPHLTGAAAEVPVLVEQGGQDQTVTPALGACVLDRMQQDKANYTLCFDPTASHGGVIAFQANYVNQWIAQQALDAGAPDAACQGNHSYIPTDSGAPVACNTELGTQ
jgi:predicted esterase